MDEMAARMKAANDAFVAAFPVVMNQFMQTPEARSIASAFDVLAPGWRRT